MSRNPSGFSLVEALVAMAIIAAMAAALATTLADHARSRRALAERRLGLMMAQSALARAEAGDRADTGRFRDLTWRVVREPYDAGGTIGAGGGFGVAAPLEHITVVVENDAHRQVASLRSVRIAP